MFMLCYAVAVCSYLGFAALGGFGVCCLLVDWLLGLFGCGGCYWFRLCDLVCYTDWL